MLAMNFPSSQQEPQPQQPQVPPPPSFYSPNSVDSASSPYTFCPIQQQQQHQYQQPHHQHHNTPLSYNNLQSPSHNSCAGDAASQQGKRGRDSIDSLASTHSNESQSQQQQQQFPSSLMQPRLGPPHNNYSCTNSNINHNLHHPSYSNNNNACTAQQSHQDNSSSTSHHDHEHAQESSMHKKRRASSYIPPRTIPTTFTSVTGTTLAAGAGLMFSGTGTTLRRNLSFSRIDPYVSYAQTPSLFVQQDNDDNGNTTNGNTTSSSDGMDMDASTGGEQRVRSMSF